MSTFKPYEGKDPYIFMSFDPSDKQTALHIIEGLCTRGYRVWYSETDPADISQLDHIADRLDNCGVFVALVSAATQQSQSGKREINYAISKWQEPVVVYLEQVELSLGMQMQLSTADVFYYRDYKSPDAFLDALCTDAEVSRCKGKYNGQAVQKGWYQLEKRRSEQEYKQGLEQLRRGARADALRYFESAAEQGHAEAIMALGDIYFNGKGEPKDEKKGMELYKRSAELGCAEAQYILAFKLTEQAYRSGDDQKLHRQAAEWYLRAAKQGHVYAMVELAQSRSWGRGVDEDAAEAVYWYKKAAQLGDRKAQYEIGRKYMFGYDVAQDKKEGIKWLEKSAAQKHTDAICQLAQCYEEGDGVAKDAEKAKYWWRIGAQAGSRYAKDKLEGRTILG